MNKKVQEILDFWFKDTPPKKRFQKHKGFDQEIRDKFLNRFKNLEHEYITADLFSPIADVKADITNLPFEENTFNSMFIHFHDLWIKNNCNPINYLLLAFLLCCNFLLYFSIGVS